MCTSCKEETPDTEFVGKEAEYYKQLKLDHEAPKYKWGYFSDKGKLVIRDLYDDNRDFSNGYAAVQKGGLWGMIDQKGKTSIPIRFKTITPCQCDRIVAQDLVDTYHIFSCSGILIKDSLNYATIYPYTSDRARISNGQKVGFLDKYGEVMIPIELEDASDMNDKYAVVSSGFEKALIDVNGLKIIKGNYDKIWHPRNGYIRYKRGNAYGFVDVLSKEEIEGLYDYATDYNQDYALVQKKGKYALLNREGMLTQLPYSYVDIGGEGKWIYASENKFGFLKNNGDVLSLPQYDLLHRYAENRAVFSSNSVWGYLNEDGKMYIPPRYPLAWDFKNGYARTIDKNGFGFINKEGEDPFVVRFLEVRDFHEGLARVQIYR